MVTENYVQVPVRRVKRVGFVPMQRPIVFFVFYHRGYKEAAAERYCSVVIYLDILLEVRADFWFVCSRF